MNKYIYLVGKPDPQLAAVKSVQKAGYQVGIFLDTHATIKNTAAYDSVIRVDFDHLDRELPRLAALDLPIAGLLCTYENYILARAQLAQALRVPGLSVAAAERCTDKYLMRQAFSADAPNITPAFQRISSLEQAQGFAKAHGYPVIIKPTNLVKSLLVLRCSNDQELYDNFTYAINRIAPLYQKYRVFDREPALIIEQYVTGASCSIAAFVDAQGEPHFCEGVTALTNAQDIGAADNYIYNRKLPARLHGSLSQSLFITAREAIKALSMSSSPDHVELIYAHDKVWVIEIGARIGGYRPRMYELSYGIDLHAQEIAIAVGQAPELVGNFRAFSAVYELFPAREGHFRTVIHRADFSPQNYAYYAVKAHPGALVGPAKNGYKAAAIVIASHPNYETFAAQCAAIEGLSVEVGP
jgi:biotin carboxylase